MDLRFSGQFRSYIFIAVLGLTLIALAAAWRMGSGQDKIFLANYREYQQGIALMGQGDFAQALHSFQGLDANSLASYQVLYMTAYCEAQTQDYESAARHMQMAREARPALVQDQKYLERYGVILFNLGDYQQAALYLNESLKYPNDDGTTREAKQYLARIADI